MLDFNDAAPQRDNGLIPPCITKIRGALRPGDQNGPGPEDMNILKSSQTSNALMLDWEFTVVSGPHANRKFFQNMVISGGKVDDKGVSIAWQITKSTLRAMLESAFGIMPKDESAEAKAKRSPPGFRNFEGLEFIVKIGIEKGGNYDDKNKIEIVITPDMKEYAAAMAGETIEVATKAKAAPAAGAAAWGGAAPASASAQKWGGAATPIAQAKPPAASTGSAMPAWAQ